mgnify:CR=1 FL=1
MLSTFLQIGRVLDFDDFLALTSAGAVEWDPRGEALPPRASLEKHGNVGAWIVGDREAPLVRMRNVRLLCVLFAFFARSRRRSRLTYFAIDSGFESKGLVMAISFRHL